MIDKEEIREQIDLQTSKLKRYFGAVKGLALTYPNQARGLAIFGVFFVLVAIAYLVWPSSEPNPPQQHVEDQIKTEIKAENLGSQAAEKLENAVSIDKEAENVSKATETAKKRIVERRKDVEKAKEKVVDAGVDDVSDVPSNESICTRSKSLGIRCDTDR